MGSLAVTDSDYVLSPDLKERNGPPLVWHEASAEACSVANACQVVVAPETAQSKTKLIHLSESRFIVQIKSQGKCDGVDIGDGPFQLDERQTAHTLQLAGQAEKQSQWTFVTKTSRLSIDCEIILQVSVYLSRCR